jgi:hypothetical protein
MWLCNWTEVQEQTSANTKPVSLLFLSRERVEAYFSVNMLWHVYVMLMCEG